MPGYTEPGFKTKKDLKQALEKGKRVRVYEMSPKGEHQIMNGERFTIVGPSPDDRKWYGEVAIKEGLVTSIR